MQWINWLPVPLALVLLTAAIGCAEYADFKYLEQGLTVCDDGDVFDSGEYICDGIPDCRDGSDESAERCDGRTFICEHDGDTFHHADRCDGIADCSVSTYDETSEPTDEKECGRAPAWTTIERDDIERPDGADPDDDGDDHDPKRDDSYADPTAFDGECSDEPDAYGPSMVACRASSSTVFDPGVCGSWHMCTHSEMLRRLHGATPPAGYWLNAVVTIAWNGGQAEVQAFDAATPPVCMETTGSCSGDWQVQAMTASDPDWNEYNPDALWVQPIVMCPDPDSPPVCDTHTAAGTMCCR